METILERAMEAAADEENQIMRQNASHRKTAMGDIKGDEGNVLFAALLYVIPIINRKRQGQQVHNDS